MIGILGFVPIGDGIREAAVFSAWLRQDANLAENWLALLKHPKQVLPLLQFRTEIAMLSAWSRFDESLARWHEGFSRHRKHASFTE